MTQLTLNLGGGSIAFQCSPSAAQDIKTSLNTIMASLKTVAAQTASGNSKPSPQKPIEYRQVGDVFLEIFCNPNIWPSPFAAKVLITLRDDRIRIITEADLSQVLDDVNQFLEQH
ncbi:hypothetical protein [Prochlorothrix hollandica]|uniref:Uncharacterized protein n=1 Tax=Prochlorothrix hollandica PCC 9006 = CALU 1027 TaxID=317619 RepID=A0A0M2Q0L6_PROHO|nr:hypothetical protein [Prochlorothrix hollandica]KKJ00838.1 hypothetical protein PROH_06290 [Prochlorothrix hollandica PCC 9006 = CALU 1027]